MTEIIGWILLAFSLGMTLGMFIGENWSRWDKLSREKYCNQEPRWWFKRQAD